MSDEQSSQEKEHKPSPKRLKELKKKGTFLRAKDMISATVLVGSIALLLIMAPMFSDTLKNNFTQTFTHIADTVNLGEQPDHLLQQLAIQNLLLILPFGIILIILCFLTTFAFGGFGFATSLLKFKGERLSPMKNLKRIFSLNNAFELVKATVKFCLFIAVLGFFIKNQHSKLFGFIHPQNTQGLTEGIDFIRLYLVLIIPAILLIAAFDMIYNKVTFDKKNKMSHQEVKDENKETEGNPENKKRQRSLQNALSRQKIQLVIPKATVILTNPTHYAVALQYDEQKDNAPKIIAKGQEHNAAFIRKLAIQHGIPIYQAPELTRAIYFTGKVNSYIHEELYMSVAIVLSYIYQLKLYQLGQSEYPIPTNDLQIPEKFRGY